ncbi:MAG: inositol monophosphatase [Opitutales bacterium]
MSTPVDLHQWSRDLIALGLSVRSALRDNANTAIEARAEVAKTEDSDFIYQIDLESEEVILRWFEENWKDRPPVQLVMEGIESMGDVIFPKSAQAPEWICIIDPIDGTRGLMYDKRSAWFIAGMAPIKSNGNLPTLADLKLSVIVELPTSKAGYADHLAAVKGCGPKGVICERIQLFDKSISPLAPRPYSGTELLHGFASFCKFFPEGKTLTAEAETAFFQSLDSTVSAGAPLIFDDQYISTAGQFYEILMGHDRMIADLRPEVFNKLGLEAILCCHPYDIAGWLIPHEAGCIIETPDGKTLNAPLDTTSPISWIAYANRDMAAAFRPKLNSVRNQLLGSTNEP